MPTSFTLWRKARRVNGAASWLPGTNRLGFQSSMAVSEGTCRSDAKGATELEDPGRCEYQCGAQGRRIS